MEVEQDIDFSWDESFDKLFGNESEETKPKKKDIDTDDETSVDDKPLTDEEFINSFAEDSDDESIVNDDKGEDSDDDDEKSDISASDSDDKDEDKEIFSSLYKDLKEHGVLTGELEDGEELDSDNFLKKFEQELDKRVEEELVSFASGFDDEAKAFIEFKKNGGATLDFLKSFEKQSELPVTDVESVENQESFMRYYLRTEEEMDYDEIDEEIELYKERNQLEKKASKIFNKISQQAEEEKQHLMLRQKQSRENEEKSKIEFVKKIDETLQSTETIGEFNITTEDKKDLVNFIVKPSVNVNNRKVTGMQAKINEIYSNPEKLLLFAKLIKNDFDLGDLVKRAETKATKKALGVITSKRKNSAPKVSMKGKYLADFFK